MDSNNKIILENKKSSITLEDRKKIVLTGVLDVISFDEEQISLNTKLGGLNITGTSLKVNKLDVQNGDIVILGMIKSIVYSSKKAKRKLNLFKRKGRGESWLHQ